MTHGHDQVNQLDLFCETRVWRVGERIVAFAVQDAHVAGVLEEHATLILMGLDPISDEPLPEGGRVHMLTRRVGKGLDRSYAVVFEAHPRVLESRSVAFAADYLHRVTRQIRPLTQAETERLVAKLPRRRAA